MNADLIGLDLKQRLGEIGAACEALFHKGVKADGLGRIGNYDAIGRHDLAERGGEDGGAGPDEEVAKDDLLLAIEALRLHDIELTAADER